MRIAALMLAAAMFIAASAQRPLRFDSISHDFKIVQFTDNHYKWGKGASRATVECMEAVLEAEQPDLVVFTGDQVYSDSVFQSLDAVFRPVVDRGLPFAYVFGNHDTQFERSHSEIYDHLQTMPGSLMPPRGEAESPDYVLEIGTADAPDSLAAVLYLLDSHTVTPYPGTGKYAWLTLPQIQWYKETSQTYADSLGISVPALMFFHIPLPEYGYAWADRNNFGVGTHGEDVCSPKLNSGMFAAIKERGDVMGVFCGHDHDNDFAVRYYDVLLAYGRYSGGKTVYNHLGRPGARVIVLHQGSRSFDTWLRLADGTQLYSLTFPEQATGKRRR